MTSGLPARSPTMASTLPRYRFGSMTEVITKTPLTSSRSTPPTMFAVHLAIRTRSAAPPPFPQLILATLVARVGSAWELVDYDLLRGDAARYRAGLPVGFPHQCGRGPDQYLPQDHGFPASRRSGDGPADGRQPRHHASGDKRAARAHRDRRRPSESVFGSQPVRGGALRRGCHPRSAQT